MSLIIVIYNLYNIVHSQCAWNATIYPYNNSTIPFYLACEEHKVLTSIDYSYHSYHYNFSLCGNDVSCNGEKGMVLRYLFSDPNQCSILAKWNASIIPTQLYSDSFTFKYANVDSTGCNGPIQWDPTFECGPQEMDMLYVNSGGLCHFSTDIKTKYACPGNTECKFCQWKTSDGQHILDMQSVAGQSLSIINKENNDLYYVYTPCTNTFRCDDDQYAMAYLFNITSNECDKYLAIWENGQVETSYSPEKKIWQFVYTNGQTCDGLDVVFIVDWICDPNATSPQIIQAKKIATCAYQLDINSTLACH